MHDETVSYIEHNKRMHVVEREREKVEGKLERLPSMSDHELKELVEKVNRTISDIGRRIKLHSKKLRKSGSPGQVKDELVNIVVEAEVKRLNLKLLKAARLAIEHRK